MELCHEGDEGCGCGVGLEGEEAGGEKVGFWVGGVGAPCDGLGDVVGENGVEEDHGGEFGGDHCFSAVELVDLHRCKSRDLTLVNTDWGGTLRKKGVSSPDGPVASILAVRAQYEETLCEILWTVVPRGSSGLGVGISELGLKDTDWVLLSRTPWSMYWIMRSGTGGPLSQTDFSVILVKFTLKVRFV